MVEPKRTSSPINSSELVSVHGGKENAVASPIAGTAGKIDSLSAHQEEKPQDNDSNDILIAAGDGIFNLISEIDEGFSAEDFIDVLPRYKVVKAEIENKKQQLEALFKEPEPDEDAILTLQLAIAELVVEKEEIDQTLSKKGIATLMSIIELGIDAIPLINAIKGSASLRDNFETAQAINAEMEEVEKEIKNESNATVKEVLNLKLNSLKQQAEENKINAVRNLSRLSGIMTAIIVPEVAAGLEVGVETAAAVGALGVGTGVGICIFVGLSLVIGTGYLVYKNKESINNKFQNMKFDFQKWQATGYGKRNQSLEQLPQLHKRLSLLGHSMENIGAKISDEEIVLIDQINDLMDSQRRLTPGTPEFQTMEAEITRLSLLKNQLTSNRHNKLSDTHAEIINLEPKVNELTSIHATISAIGEKQEQANDEYQYGQHLNMFKDTSIDSLKKIEQDVKTMDPDDFKRLQERFDIKVDQSSVVIENVVSAVKRSRS